MPIRELAELTWEDVRDLDHARTVAVLPTGALEAHGPHLPIATDVVIADGMARAGAASLETLGYGALLLPPVHFTAAPFAAAFPGTISFAPTTVVELVLEVARALTRQGFAALAIANAHLDPAHRAALSDACARVQAERLLPVAYPDIARKPWALRLGEEFRTGACHAGRYEGSMVLALRPDLVRDEIRRSLAPNPASLSTAIRDGRHTFEEAGGSRAYFGWPAEATAEEGRATLAALGAILAESVREALAHERAERSE